MEGRSPAEADASGRMVINTSGRVLEWRVGALFGRMRPLSVGNEVAQVRVSQRLGMGRGLGDESSPNLSHPLLHAAWWIGNPSDMARPSLPWFRG